MDNHIDNAAAPAVEVVNDLVRDVNDRDDAGGGESPEAHQALVGRSAATFAQRAPVAAVTRVKRTESNSISAVPALLLMPAAGFLGASLMEPSFHPSAIVLVICIGSSLAALWIATNTSDLDGAAPAPFRFKNFLVFGLTIISLATFVIGALQLTVEYKACPVDGTGFRLPSCDKKPV